MPRSLEQSGFLTRREIPEFLAQHGFRIGRSTIDKLSMPSRGNHEGPKPAGIWGNRHLYRPAQVLAWARRRFRLASVEMRHEHQGSCSALHCRRRLADLSDGPRSSVGFMIPTTPCPPECMAELANFERQTLRTVTAEQKRLGKPETFNFLGFTFICGKTRSAKFLLIRKTRRDRMRAKLRRLKQEMWRRMHHPIPQQGKWLGHVVHRPRD
jgi:hypothetical protein